MSIAPKSRPTRVDVRSRNRLLDDFFKVDEVKVSFERFDRTMSQEQRFLMFESGDTAAALLYDPEENTVIVVSQFRAPMLDRSRERGWIVEAPAGLIKSSTPEETIVSRIRVETGYHVTDIVPIASFFSSPGRSTERIHLFYAEVAATDRIGSGGGSREEGEDIRVEQIRVETFFERLAAKEFEDAKLIIAGQWLRERLSKPLVNVAERTAQTVSYGLKGVPGKVIGYKIGDILSVRDVEVWVNSESTDMIMDRFFGRSISATIRLHGAKKHPESDRILEDTIGDELAAEMGRNTYVRPGAVLRTGPGELARTNKVRRIFHVAAVLGRIGEGLSANLDTLGDCVTNVVAAIERDSAWPTRGFRPYHSVLIPLFGTGQGRFPATEVTPRLVRKALEFFRTNRHTHLRHIYFLAYTSVDRAIIEAVFNSMADELEPLAQAPVLAPTPAAAPAPGAAPASTMPELAAAPPDPAKSA